MNYTDIASKSEAELIELLKEKKIGLFYTESKTKNYATN